MSRYYCALTFCLLLGGPAFAQDTAAGLVDGKVPVWAYPVAPPAPHGAGATAPDDGSMKHVPGSTVALTAAQIHNLFQVPDWFPDGHPKMPEVVSQGRKPAVFACGYCHLPNGQGRPENASVAGLPFGYIVEQMADFKSGVREGSEPRMPSVTNMVKIGKAADEEEVKTAAEYFSSIKLKPWIRVIETDQVPVTTIAGGMLVVAKEGGKEPIGQRVIEIPEDLERTELRDPTSGFIAYAPVGSLARGEKLVLTGGDGKTIRCTLCHGAALRGLGNVPSISGRSPSQMARQIIDIQTGARNGPWTQLMKEAVSRLTNDDIVAITAYLASRTP
jgi:cytochrome c553